MRLLTPSGKTVNATITTDHSASCHGLPVVVICGTAHGAVDLVGHQLAEATEEEMAEIERGGYTSLLRSAVPGLRVPLKYRSSEHE